MPVHRLAWFARRGLPRAISSVLAGVSGTFPELCSFCTGKNAELFLQLTGRGQYDVIHSDVLFSKSSGPSGVLPVAEFVELTERSEPVVKSEESLK